MTAPPCPECGKPLTLVTRGGVFAECAACHWTQIPRTDLVVAAAVETYHLEHYRALDKLAPAGPL